MTRLPSSDGVAARGPLGRFDTDVSFDAKVTGGTTLCKAGEDDHRNGAAAVGAQLFRAEKAAASVSAASAANT